MAGTPAAAADPLVYLFDVPETAAVPLSDQGLSKQVGWLRLEEDDRSHHFAGCPVLVNDKLAAVVHKERPEVDVYVHGTQGLKLCARLQPITHGRTDSKATAVSIRENSRTVAAIEAAVKKGKLAPEVATLARKRISKSGDLWDASKADLVIEAVFENMALGVPVVVGAGNSIADDVLSAGAGRAVEPALWHAHHQRGANQRERQCEH